MVILGGILYCESLHLRLPAEEAHEARGAGDEQGPPHRSWVVLPVHDVLGNPLVQRPASRNENENR